MMLGGSIQIDVGVSLILGVLAVGGVGVWIGYLMRK